MKVITNTDEMSAFSAAAHRDHETIGLVPTMGALHKGHLSLILKAKEICDKVVVSIYVNPIQFGPKEDLATYPRPIEDDLSECRAAGVDAVFAPSNDEIYKPHHSTYVEEHALSNRLCGLKRPGHFRGVTTVVLKLFNIVNPDKAVFGKKDAQQARIIIKMLQDLNVPVEIVLSDTVREPDGLAMSSRNRYLSASERQKAIYIYKALSSAKPFLEKGIHDSNSLRESIIEVIKPASPDLELEYLEIMDSKSLEPVQILSGNILIAIAARVGSTRLIDNIEIAV